MAETDGVIELDAVALDDQIEQATKGFGALRSRIATKLADYDGAAVTDLESYRAVKGYRADINAMRKEIDDSRKAIKKAYTARLSDFEEQVKDVKKPLDDADTHMGAMVHRWEQDLHDARHELVRNSFEETYPALVGVVDFDLIDSRHMRGQSSWYASSVSDKKALEMLKADADEIASTERSIDGAQMDDAQRVALKADYFSTLSLPEAIDRQRKRMEDAARQAEDEARVKQMEQKRFEADEIEQPAQKQPSTPVEIDSPKTFVLTIDATSKQLSQLKDAMVSVGIHGSISPFWMLVDKQTQTEARRAACLHAHVGRD